MSKQDKSTPGPWRIHEFSEVTILSINGILISHTIHKNSTRGFNSIEPKEAIANATLIARAPDLLRENRELAGENKRLREATTQAIKDLETVFIIDGISYTHDFHALEVLKQALEGK